MRALFATVAALAGAAMALLSLEHLLHPCRSGGFACTGPSTFRQSTFLLLLSGADALPQLRHCHQWRAVERSCGRALDSAAIVSLLTLVAGAVQSSPRASGWC